MVINFGTVILCLLCYLITIDYRLVYVFYLSITRVVTRFLRSFRVSRGLRLLLNLDHKDPIVFLIRKVTPRFPPAHTSQQPTSRQRIGSCHT